LNEDSACIQTVRKCCANQHLRAKFVSLSYPAQQLVIDFRNLQKLQLQVPSVLDICSAFRILSLRIGSCALIVSSKCCFRGWTPTNAEFAHQVNRGLLDLSKNSEGLHSTQQVSVKLARGWSRCP
jgi:hypothetical protein